MRLWVGLGLLLACGKTTTVDDAKAVECPYSAPLEEVSIDELCEDGGDPNEDVDPENASRKYTPRPVLPLSLYTTTVRAKPSELGGVRIRSRLIFAADDERNVLGKLPSCVAVRAAGPMKNKTFSAGLGWSIRVVDRQNKRCQGFVSTTVVTAL